MAGQHFKFKVRQRVIHIPSGKRVYIKGRKIEAALGRTYAVMLIPRATWWLPESEFEEEPRP